MTAQPQVAPITYGYIYSHMRKHQRVTTLAILNPGDDFIDGIPCDSVADAAERADGMGVMLLDISGVHEILKQRRAATADVASYLELDAFASHAAEEAPMQWNAPTQPELTVLDAPEPEYVERLPLTTSVRLRNGVEGVVSGHNPNDVNRVRVSWFDTHFWAVRHLWMDRGCVEVLPTALETTEAVASA